MQVKMSAAEKPIKLLGVNPHFRHNGFHHYTEQYDINTEHTGLVVRRGAPFRLDFRFNNDIDDYDLLTVHLAAEDYGAEHLKFQWKVKESPRKFLLDDTNSAPIQIFRVIQKADKRTVTVIFYSRVNAVVSKYNITGVSVWRSRNEYFSTEINFPIYLIFNPFHEDDLVYMTKEDERQEYVLQDEGRVYFGSSRKIGSRPWYFAQFENPVLSCALLLLAKSSLKWENWGDPVLVARTLSAMVNNVDDDGLLVGNWSGNYSGGVAPTEWKGSLRIIEEYFRTQTPVQFGQCWVFSGCMTSLARSLGIPCRSVTNFDSAHDTDANLTVDNYFDDSYMPITDRNSDSVWNFHVWNDLWMRRPDLAENGEFDGWQAIDATPQETSEDIYQTGPCSLNAIKRGLVNLQFDGKFVFAEVNACIKHWAIGKDGSRKEIFSDPRKVGQSISTKAVGSDERQDVTHQYKYNEGTPEEEEAFKCAESQLNVAACDRTNDAAKERYIRLSLNAPNTCLFGSNLDIGLEMSNQSKQVVQLQYTATVTIKKYNGHIMGTVKQEKDSLNIRAGATKTMKLSVAAEDYVKDCGTEEFGFEIVAVLTDADGRKQVSQSIIHVTRPDVLIELTGELKQNKDFRLNCSFMNPLPINLTGCAFSVDGPGLRGQLADYPVSDLAPGQTAKCSLTLNPARAGQRKFVVSFNSAELKGAYCEQPVVVVPDPGSENGGLLEADIRP
ncbi:hypothetical protein BOX15_Mlig026787g1 [Macrostomum lignano]|uniref:protein-glutamine gamma-glutamyltransferase n=1 Tax=Macrostomum lignano TaxID=282301 RepID=A0A267H8H8_9PLAT|nr:hypothetical protein BOX15_Mlig026787g1 [Macrostomum lignano]